MGITAKFERVTPPTAKKWLEEYNTYNRHMNKDNVRRIANAMRKGEWQENGETVKFNGDGKLIDGQHRLEAVVQTGISQRFLVVRGLGGDAYDTIDQGHPRNIAAALSRDGEKHYTELAATLKGLVVFSSRKPLEGMKERLTVPPAMKMLKDDPAIRESLGDMLHWGVKKVIGVGTGAAAYHCCRQIDKNLAVDFWKRFCTGEGLHKGEPAFLLRKRFIENREAAEKMSNATRVLIVIKCWNAARDGEAIGRMRLNSRDYSAYLR